MSTMSALPHNLVANAAHSPQDQHEREQTWFMINRAYQNIYGLNLPADATYQRTIFDAALALRRDARCATITDKMLLEAVEDIIRISDEHHNRARKHLARASNPVYLRETAMDNIVEKQKYLQAIGQFKPDSSVKVGCTGSQCTALDGRISRMQRRLSSSEMMELAYQQLAFNTTNKTS